MRLTKSESKTSSAQSAAASDRIRIVATVDDETGATVVVQAGNVRIDMAFPNPKAPIPIDDVDKKLMTLVIAQFLERGVSPRRIKSSLGRLAVLGIARHVRLALASEAPVVDFGGLPILAAPTSGVAGQGSTRATCDASTELVRRPALVAANSLSPRRLVSARSSDLLRP